MPLLILCAYICFTTFDKTKSAYMLLYALLFMFAREILLKCGLFYSFYLSPAILNIANNSAFSLVNARLFNSAWLGLV